MFKLKAALYAVGVAALLHGSSVDYALADDGGKYFLLTSEALKSKADSYDIFAAIAAPNEVGNNFYRSANERYKDASVVGYLSYEQMVWYFKDKRADILAVPENDINSDQIKMIIKENNFLILDEPLIVTE